MMKKRTFISYSITTAVPDPLRKKLNLIYQRGKYEDVGVAQFIREMLNEAADRRIQTENIKPADSKQIEKSTTNPS